MREVGGEGIFRKVWNSNLRDPAKMWHLCWSGCPLKCISEADALKEAHSSFDELVFPTVLPIATLTRYTKFLQPSKDRLLRVS